MNVNPVTGILHVHQLRQLPGYPSLMMSVAFHSQTTLCQKLLDRRYTNCEREPAAKTWRMTRSSQVTPLRIYKGPLARETGSTGQCPRHAGSQRGFLLARHLHQDRRPPIG